MGSRSNLAGMEVPIIGSDSIKWFQVSVPSSLSLSSSSEFVASAATILRAAQVLQTGPIFVKLWVGEADGEKNIIALAVLHKDASGVDADVISIYALSYDIGDMMTFKMEPSILSISLDEGGPIDVKLTPEKVWILKDDGLVIDKLFSNKGIAHSYTLEEAFVADQLFQSSEHSSDDILWLIQTVFPSSKDQISEILSSIFLQRVLLPGVYHHVAEDNITRI